MYEYNILKDEWEDTKTPMTQNRAGHSSSLINEKEIIVIGGKYYENEWVHLKSSEIFNLEQRLWRSGPELATGITFAEFVKAKIGSQYLGYLIGGYDGGSASSTIYGLTKDLQKFANIGIVQKKRERHNAFVLPENMSERCGV